MNCPQEEGTFPLDVQVLPPGFPQQPNCVITLECITALCVWGLHGIC